MKQRLQKLTSALIFSVLALSVSAQSDYVKTIQSARAERVAKLKADDGWLTVTGLFWLKEGANPAVAAKIFS